MCCQVVTALSTGCGCETPKQVVPVSVGRDVPLLAPGTALAELFQSNTAPVHEASAVCVHAEQVPLRFVGNATLLFTLLTCCSIAFSSVHMWV